MPPPQRLERKEEEACDGHSGMDSEGGDVIECVVQLLADGLVLHLLCIDFIWGVRGGGGGEEVEEGVEEGRRGGGGGGEDGGREDDEMENRIREMGRGERRGQTGQMAARASSSPFSPRFLFVLCTLTCHSPPAASPRSLWAVL